MFCLCCMQKDTNEMVFSGFEFILYFLPIFLAVYYIIPQNRSFSIPLKNFVLLVGSLCFYAFGEPVYVFLMAGSVVVNYLLAQGLDYLYGKPAYVKGRKALFVFILALNVGILFFFKYCGFFALNINILLYKANITWITLPVISEESLPLPIGISFYTFQILSYVIDVYRRTYPAEKNFLRLGAYITMFPQLVAGPIVKYTEVKRRLTDRRTTLVGFDHGLKLFILGMGFKVLIANQIGILWTDIERIGYESISTPLAWMGAAAYSFQIYYDFFGYSVMAAGLGKMLGFYLPENFRDPYASKSVTELWQRWHITLGRWFREYLYFPLGGSRCGRGRMVRNLLIVWAVTGFWHGADWNFIFWGLGWFVFIMLEKLFLKKYLDSSRVLGRVYMLFLIPVSWVVFAITEPGRLAVYLNRMFPVVKMDYVPNVNAMDYVRYGKTYALLFAVSILICVPKVRKSLMLIQRSRFGTLAAYVIFLLCLYCLALGMDNPFLYYKF